MDLLTLEVDGSLANPYAVATVAIWTAGLTALAIFIARRFSKSRSDAPAWACLFAVALLVTPLAQPLTGTALYSLVNLRPVRVGFWGGPPNWIAPAVSCVVGVSLVAAGGQAPKACSFPGPPGCADPPGRFTIDWREPTGDDERHELWLEARANGTRTKLFEFGRGVDVLWAPDGAALAITDYAGSSDSVVWVGSGADLTHLVNVEDGLRASLGELPEIYGNGHRYFEAVRWIRPGLLLFRVRAYDAHPGREYVRTFRYNTRTQTVVRRR